MPEQRRDPPELAALIGQADEASVLPEQLWPPSCLQKAAQKAPVTRLWHGSSCRKGALPAQTGNNDIHPGGNDGHLQLY